MGGIIRVDSDGKTGSTFYFEIPYIAPTDKQLSEFQSDNESCSEKKAMTIEKHNIKPGKVLVAEDNMVNQKVIQRILANIGIEADIASNGQEGTCFVMFRGLTI